MNTKNDNNNLPDIRDGLTRKERIVLECLNRIQKERQNRNVPVAMLYGIILEQVDMSIGELQTILQRMTGDHTNVNGVLPVEV